MRTCVATDQKQADALMKEGVDHDSLFFFVPTPGTEADNFPCADLYVLPAQLFLVLPEGSLKAPVFAFGHEGYMVACFERGCMDYLREPWTMDELAARSLRILRCRVSLAGSMLVITGRNIATERGSVRLTEEEFRILRLLVLNLNKPVPRASLCSALNGFLEENSRAPDVHISAIRRKFRAILPNGTMALRACRGKGYMLEGESCG